MAGIGFELQKSLDRRTYTAYLQAYFTAMAYSSGPWICTLVALTIISAVAKPALGVKPVAEFTSILCYIYAGSLILSGPIQLMLTRFVADKLYTDDRDGILSGVLDACVLAGGLAALGGSAFAVRTGLPVELEIAAVVVLVVITVMWIAMAYVTALKEYRSVTATFATGALLSVLLAVGLAREAGLSTLGLLVGFGLGHCATLAGLFAVSVREFRFDRRPSTDFLVYFVRIPGLWITGLLSNLGLWVDKLVIWGLKGIEEVPGFLSYWPYDIPLYLAYLSVLPSQAFFLIKIETRFDERYQRYLRAMLESPAEVVVKRKREMLEALSDGLSQLFKFQGVISLVLILLAPDILRALKLHTLDVLLVQGLMVAAYFHFGFLHVLVFMMYLDRRREMVEALVAFVLLSGIGTALSVTAFTRPAYWCAGYLFASGLALAATTLRLLALAENIDYLLLFKQELRDGEQRLITFRPATDPME